MTASTVYIPDRAAKVAAMFTILFEKQNAVNKLEALGGSFMMKADAARPYRVVWPSGKKAAFKKSDNFYIALHRHIEHFKRVS